MAEHNAIQKSEGHDVQVREERAEQNRWCYLPPVDVFDEPDAYTVVAELPGTRADRIDLSLERGVLTLRAPVERRIPEQARSIRAEYGVGDYERRLEFGQAVDPEGITAEYVDGVLTVRLSKAETARGRRIPISTGE